MPKFLLRLLAFLGSKDAQRALEIADRVIDLAKEAQKKLPKK